MNGNKIRIFATLNYPNAVLNLFSILGTISINGGNPRCSVVAGESVKQYGYSMEVNMRKKKMKTAIGVMAEGKSFEYMRT